MTVEEIAAITRLAPITVYRVIKKGELKAVRLGRSIRVYESEFRRCVKA